MLDVLQKKHHFRVWQMQTFHRKLKISCGNFMSPDYETLVDLWSDTIAMVWQFPHIPHLFYSSLNPFKDRINCLFMVSRLPGVFQWDPPYGSFYDVYIGSHIAFPHKGWSRHSSDQPLILLGCSLLWKMQYGCNVHVIGWPVWGIPLGYPLQPRNHK